MRLAEALSLPPGPGRVIALVGAGGKTSALFGLGEELALGPARARVLLTTTTHIYDPRLEPGRGFDRVVLAPALADPDRDGPEAPPPPGPGPCRVVLAAGEDPATGKLRGIHPDQVARLAPAWDYIVLEADGGKRLPVKAPAGHEPVVPRASALVLGFVGLACLGRPMDGRTVHRPERFGPVTGCAPGAAITLAHLAALARSPQGLFKDAPPGALRVLVLNQADLCDRAPAELAAGLAAQGPLGVDRVLVCALGAARPEGKVLLAQAL